ncbi:hypothetical protein AB0C52_12845 [Streptomyces sp. NPDC048717]|uniref:hypothetical protein n=1 Tax=Streptomyces sp. NPDC048717 TaxID=3154928 RepID=UPI00343B9710
MTSTSIPPMALARHYYETRRELLLEAGMRVPGWFRLTPDERAVAVAEASLIREAVRRTEKEEKAFQQAVQALSARSRARHLPLV